MLQNNNSNLTCCTSPQPHKQILVRTFLDSSAGRFDNYSHVLNAAGTICYPCNAAAASQYEYIRRGVEYNWWGQEVVHSSAGWFINFERWSLNQEHGLVDIGDTLHGDAVTKWISNKVSLESRNTGHDWRPVCLYSVRYVCICCDARGETHHAPHLSGSFDYSLCIY